MGIFTALVHSADSLGQILYVSNCPVKSGWVGGKCHQEPDLNGEDICIPWPA